MVLTLRLLLTPCLIASASLVERRWGTAVSGWFMGFPFISAPISIILALEYGPGFAARSAVGTLGGLTSVCAFCLVYTLAARKADWPLSLAGGLGAFLLVTAGWNAAPQLLWPTFAIGAISLVLTLWLIPRRTLSARPPQLPQWELPARMLVAALFVWVLTASANFLGPILSGLLSPFPVINSVVAPFTQRRSGAMAATQLLRGVVMGLCSFACFYVVLSVLLPSQPLLIAYGGATAASLLVHSVALRFVEVSQPGAGGK
jgi:hypothetical protein